MAFKLLIAFVEFSPSLLYYCLTIFKSTKPGVSICFYRINFQGIPFSQTNLCVAQPLNTLMMSASVMVKPIVAQVLLAEARGVRLAKFLFFLNSDCLFYCGVEATNMNLLNLGA